MLDISKIFKTFKGIIEVEVSGFFVERFINLSSTNKIKIWDIQTIRNGSIYFKTDKSNFKEIKKIAKIAKCNIKIIKKKGIYFFIIRYKKRRISLFIAIITVITIIILSTFVLRIEIKGNEKISNNEIKNSLKKGGLYLGKNIFFISKRDVIDYVRADLQDISWIGIDLKGTTAKVKVVEKTKSSENENKNIIGDIVSSDTGILTKIIAEKGTPKFATGSYIVKGTILISGTIESKFLNTEYVKAKGIIKIKKSQIFSGEIKYKEKVKEFTGKNKYGFRFYIKNKKYDIKYLPKDKKYDININVKNINIFGIKFKLGKIKYKEYIFNNVDRNYSDLLNILNKNKKEIEKKLILKNYKILTSAEQIDKTKIGIKYTEVYDIEKDGGEFIPRK